MPGLGMAVGGAGGLAGGSAGVGGSLFDGPPWLAWRTEQVDPDGSLGPVDVAFLSDGTPVVHYTASHKGARVAERTVTGWEVTGLEEQSKPGAMGVDSQDRVFVAYEPGTPLRVAVSQPGLGEFSIETVHTGAGDPALAVTPSDEVHLLYKTSPDDGLVLNHAVRTGEGSYDVTRIEEGVLDLNEFDSPALASDEDGNLHAVWKQFQGNSVEIRYGFYDADADTWSFDWLTDCAFDTQGADVAVDDSTDTVHAVCKGGGQGLLHHEKPLEGGSWSTRVAATGDDTVPPRDEWRMAKEPGVAAQDGVVHMAWRTHHNPGFPDDPTRPAQLYYTVREDGSYWTEPADASGTGVGFDSGIGVDEEGYPWIGYVYSWRSRTVDSMERVNPSQALYVSHPVVATGSFP
jgi:hypothetical protein